MAKQKLQGAHATKFIRTVSVARTGVTFLLAILILLVVLESLTGLRHGLIDPDEGRYAEIAREMLESGDFVTPRLNYVKYFEKPVLHYWLTALSFKLFGFTETAARVTPVIFGAAGVLVTFLLARRMTRRVSRSDKPGAANASISKTRAGFFAAAILSSSILWYAMSHMNIIDMTLTFFFTLAMAGYYCWYRSGANGKRRTLWILVFYAGMALATLTKGLIGVVLPGGIALLHLLIMTLRTRPVAKSNVNRLREVLSLFSLKGIPLYFILVLPWFLLVCYTNRDFFYFFFIREHFLRYMTTVHDRWEPVWFFIPVLLGALVPWTGLLLDAYHTARGHWGGILGRGDGLFLTLWAGVPFVFFSLSSSKLVPYILPCLPPIAILMGASLEVMMDRSSRWGTRRFVVITTLVLLPLIIAGILYPRTHPEFPKNLTLPLVIALFVFWSLSFALFWKRRIIAPALCLVAFLVPLSCTNAFDYFADLHSQREIAAMIKERARYGDKIVAWRELLQGLAFYTGRRVITAETLSELEFGANALGADSAERASWFLNARELRRLWNGPNRVFLVLERKHINDFARNIGREPVRLGETRGEILCANF